MTTLGFEWSMYLTGLMVVVFLIISLMMMLIVLIQRPQGGGLSGAFGGSGPDGAGQTAFGAKTGDVLTTVTIAIFVLFLLSAIALNYVVQPPQAPEAPAVATTPGSGTPATPIPIAPPTSAPVGVPPQNVTLQQTPASAPVTDANGNTVLQTEHGTVIAPAGLQVKKVDVPPPGAPGSSA